MLPHQPVFAMNHVVLLGDSSFDNAAYVEPDGSPVIEWLEDVLPTGWRATLLAVDGSTTHDIVNQLQRLPEFVTHLVVSVGGNDALLHAGLLSETANSVADVLSRLAAVRATFARDYAAMLRAVQTRNRPTIVSTIYEPRFDDPLQQMLASTALTLFNDVILRQATEAGLAIIDLRLVCREAEHYANPIEPSSLGGHRIAGAIAHALGQHRFDRPRTSVYF